MSVTDKFLSYIKISSPSDENCENCPSSPCQLDVAEFLKNEMTAMGLCDVRVEKGYFTAVCLQQKDMKMYRV